MTILSLVKHHENIVAASATVIIIGLVGFLYNKTPYYNVILVLGVLMLVILFMTFSWTIWAVD